MTSPFNEDQMKMIVYKYGELQNIGAVRRHFPAKFFPKHPRKVPDLKGFKSYCERSEALSYVTGFKNSALTHSIFIFRKNATDE